MSKLLDIISNYIHSHQSANEMENSDNNQLQFARGRPDYSAKDTDHGMIATCLDSFYMLLCV